MRPECGLCGSWLSKLKGWRTGKSQTSWVLRKSWRSCVAIWARWTLRLTRTTPKCTRWSSSATSTRTGWAVSYQMARGWLSAGRIRTFLINWIPKHRWLCGKMHKWRFNLSNLCGKHSTKLSSHRQQMSDEWLQWQENTSSRSTVWWLRPMNTQVKEHWRSRW